jgi:hypothetical protein
MCHLVLDSVLVISIAIRIDLSRVFTSNAWSCSIYDAQLSQIALTRATACTVQSVSA